MKYLICRNLRFYLVLLFCTSSLFVLTGCSQKKYKPKKVNLTFDERAAYETWKSTISVSDDNGVKARIYSNHILVYDKEKVTWLKDSVNIQFFNQYRQPSFILTCIDGKIDDVTHDMWAYKNVRAHNSEGVFITTEELKWNNKDRKFTSDKFVTIKTPAETIQGYGFESDSGLKNYVIHRITVITTSQSLTETEQVQ